MAIDFQAVRDGKMNISEYAAQFNIKDLRQATNDSIDLLLSLIANMNDADIVFTPEDPDANDPYAAEGEENLAWNMGHLIAHVTASSEEWASYSSLLARSVAYGADPRLRYETPWQDVDSKAKAVQRLEESRRIRLGYLDTWPDNPDMENNRDLSPRFIARHGEMNATACFLYGLRHEVDHYDQIREVKRQIEARSAAAAG